jgi:hypothetical protein
MLTLEQAKELLGELPKEVLEDEYYVKPFLEQIQYLIESDGEQRVRDHRVMMFNQWEYVKTLL